MRIFFLLLVFCLSKMLSAQVNFETVSFRAALEEARKQGRLMMLQFEAADCDQCNEVAAKGLSHPEVVNKLKEGFYCLKIDATHPDREAVALQYNLVPGSSYGSLFLDNSGMLLHSFFRTTTLYTDYLQQLEIARDKAGEALSLAGLEDVYKQGNRSYGFLAMLLQKRQALNLPTDTLLTAYVNALPADSLRSITTLVFIAQMAPMLGSKADQLLRRDSKAFDTAWRSINFPQRVNINNRIINKGLKKAISEKNETIALQTAAFASRTYADAGSALRAFHKNMLRYYDGIKDTLNYIKSAVTFYEGSLMRLSIDSIRILDSINVQQQLAKAPKDTFRQEGRMRIRTAVQPSPLAQNLSNELGTGALSIYQRSTDPQMLSLATTWVQKALRYYESAEQLSVYARLLYKQNQMDAAKEQMQKAIALQQKRGMPVKRFQEWADKMNAQLPLD